ncbi:hypothetical protein [Campylobacter helveticus]|uniref:hypothetical protein n=1 Tax=Campylobacter helveticus TaxID=28898 RepID=UPI002113DB06|nr:hypothetical protein [Campylobacter helveticus]
MELYLRENIIFKINEIAKDLNPSFLKDYPFEIGRTWGKYCVRLYTDKECSKTSKEIKDKDKEQTIIKDNLYLYSVNEKQNLVVVVA